MDGITELTCPSPQGTFIRRAYESLPRYVEAKRSPNCSRFASRPEALPIDRIPISDRTDRRNRHPDKAEGLPQASPGQSEERASPWECVQKQNQPRSGRHNALRIEVGVTMSRGRMPASVIFDQPTPAALAAYLDSLSEPATPSAAVAVPDTSDEPIAIVAMSCRLPGGVESPEQLWDLVVRGDDAIAPMPTDRGWRIDELFDPNPDRSGGCGARGGNRTRAGTRARARGGGARGRGRGHRRRQMGAHRRRVDGGQRPSDLHR